MAIDQNKEYNPKTIPQLRIDTEALHTARRKVQSKQPDDKVQLTADEREAVLRLISEGKKQLYPNQMAVDRYQYQLNQLSKIDKAENPEQWEKMAAKIQQFEEKYCV